MLNIVPLKVSMYYILTKNVSIDEINRAVSMVCGYRPQYVA
jgi:hypothetical protein